MNTKINNKNILCIMLVVTLLFTSCFKEPNYSNVPTLKYQKHDITNSTFDINNSQGYIYVEFTDGDADLGLLQIDTVIGGRDTIIARAGNLYYNFPKYEDDYPVYNSLTFPEIAEVDGLLPKTGILRLKMSGLFDASFPVFEPVSGKTVDTLSLKIWITDVAGNVSNTVITPEFIIKIR